MNYGSIHKPTTKEARLYAYMRQRADEWCEAIDLAFYLDRTTCLHTYIHGVREQLKAAPELGYVMEHLQKGKGQSFYRVARRGHTPDCIVDLDDGECTCGGM